MKYHSVVKSGTGISKAVIEHDSIEVLGVTELAVADAGILTTEIGENAGVVIVKDETTTDSAIFAIVDTAGTVATELIVTNASFNAAKDNASTINCYVEGGVVKVQNNSGGAVDLTVKAFV